MIKVSNDIIKFVLIEDIEKPILIDLHKRSFGGFN